MRAIRSALLHPHQSGLSVCTSGRKWRPNSCGMNEEETCEWQASHKRPLWKSSGGKAVALPLARTPGRGPLDPGGPWRGEVAAGGQMVSLMVAEIKEGIRRLQGVHSDGNYGK
ncbi:uncharacterized protein LOC144060061 [Vanacampus margaritifer]